ncbi:MAG: hypothetical protein OEW48_09230 [Phycisphaerae bacterium]|nr:hypothetical protein [Phycisphaerae bacterium]
MKRMIQSSIAVSIVLATLIGGCRPAQEQRIVFTAKISDDILTRAADLQVYMLQPSKADRSTFDSWAKQLFGDVRIDTAAQIDGLISISDPKNGSNFMMLDLETGYLSFNRGMADQIDDKPGKLPSDDEAVKLALAFLQKSKFTPADPKEMTLAHIGRIRSASFDPTTGNVGSVRDQMLTIYFDRKLNGVPVIGSGSKMLVRIGDGGQVVGGARRWTERAQGQRIEKKDLRSVAELTKDITSFLSQEIGAAERIEIVQFILTYYDNGGKYIQPVLAYEAKVTAKGMQYAYLGQTALLQSPPERVGPEPISKEALQSLKKSSPELKPPTGKPD